MLDGRETTAQDRAHSMLWKTLISLGCCLFVVVGAWTRVGAQRAGAFMGSAEDPAIGYSTSPTHNDVAVCDDPNQVVIFVNHG